MRTCRHAAALCRRRGRARFGAMAAADRRCRRHADATDARSRVSLEPQVPPRADDPRCGRVSSTPLVPGPQLFVVEDAHWVDDFRRKFSWPGQRARTRTGWFASSVVLDRDGYHPGDEATTAVRSTRWTTTTPGRCSRAPRAKHLLRPDQVDSLVDTRRRQSAVCRAVGAGHGARGRRGRSVSDSLESVVAAQIDTLPTRDRQALRYAAVLGPMFETERLVELVAADGGDAAGHAADASGVRGARRQGVAAVPQPAVPRGRIRDAVVPPAQGVARPGRRAIEAAMGSSLTDRSEILSFHFLHAQDYAKCWEYSLVAADRARTKYANVEAVHLYERALVAGAQLGDAVATTSPTPRNCSAAPRCKAACSSAPSRRSRGRGALYAGSTFDVARLCKSEALVAMNRGQSSNATRWVNKGLRLLEGHDDNRSVALRAELRQLRGEQLQRVRQNRKALEWAEQAIADAMASDNQDALAACVQRRRPGAARPRSHRRSDAPAGGAADLDRTRRSTRASHGPDDSRRDRLLERRVGRGTRLLRARPRRLHDGRRPGFGGYGTCNIADILLDQGRGDEVSRPEDVIHLWRSVGIPIRCRARCATWVGARCNAAT